MAILSDFALLAYQPALRPPDWMWRLAKLIVENRLTTFKLDRGKTVARVCRFAEHMLASPPDRRYPLGIDRELGHAWMVYTQRHTPRVRWEIEARLLTPEPVEAIATKLGLTSATVSTYADVFFDVRGLPASYILDHVFPRAVPVDESRAEELLWKSMAYQHGFAALDELLHPRSAKPNPQSLDELLADVAQSALAYETAVAAQKPSTARATAQQQRDKSSKRERERDRACQDEARDLREGIQSLLENLPWTRDAARARKLNLTSDLEKDGVGLRADELMLDACGQLPQETIDMIKSAKYPGS